MASTHITTDWFPIPKPPVTFFGPIQISLKLFNIFLIVLVMDSTYKTNKYGLLLLEFVGVTSTMLKYSIAFSYDIRKGRQLCLSFTEAKCKVKEDAQGKGNEKQKNIMEINVIDVVGDGHCGFCVVSGLLGKSVEDLHIIRLKITY
ncbi:FAR1-related protein [Trifolium medium]|uniref:FAR1-related protein n=1 Tax=Trifolium medium TaxID=97028 RepID=A0A392M2Y5_9FABA|nr:FAR1-related protein [Trifolium medium]